jgi:hypothetical protein
VQKGSKKMSPQMQAEKAVVAHDLRDRCAHFIADRGLVGVLPGGPEVEALLQQSDTQRVAQAATRAAAEYTPAGTTKTDLITATHHFDVKGVRPIERRMEPVYLLAA